MRWLRTEPPSSGESCGDWLLHGAGGRVAFLAAARGGVDASIPLYALGIAKHLDADHHNLDCSFITASVTSTYQNQRLTRAHGPSQGQCNVEVHLYPGAEHGFFTNKFSRPRSNAGGGGKRPPHISSGCSHHPLDGGARPQSRFQLFMQFPIAIPLNFRL